MKRSLLVGGALALAAGIAVALWWTRGAPAEAAYRPDFSLLDLQGETRHVSEWDQRLLLVNFWATWCTPCLAEIPLLQAAQRKYGPQGLQILGPALDQEAAVQSYVAARELTEYPVLLGESQILQLMDALGDDLGALPFTVIIDRAGRVVERHWGALSAAEIDELIQRHL